MGAVISKAADGVGNILGNAFAAPFKSIFGESCKEVCSGPWDVICFIEHLCVSNLLKFAMILGLCYIILLFFYILFKIGICQCIVKSLCKLWWGACQTYCYALEDCTCFLWHKLKNTKRVNRRRRRRDVEVGYSSSGESNSPDTYHHHHASRKRKSDREGRKEKLHSSTYSYSHRQDHHRHRHGKSRSRRPRKSGRLQLSTRRNLRREAEICKRRRIR